MVESLLCNSCGAPLDVQDSAKFVKCNHCHTTLRVHRSSNTTSTEAIEKLNETAEGLSEKLEKLTQQSELEALERNWEAQRQNFVLPNRSGDQPFPTEGAAWMGGAFIVFFGVLWTVMAIAITRSAPNFGPFAAAKVIFPLFGLGFIAFGIFTAIKIQQVAKKNRKNLKEAERAYLRRRESIIKGDD